MSQINRQFEAARRAANARVRNDLLRAMHECRVVGDGFHRGRFLADVVTAPILREPLDDATIFGLLRDLVSKGFAEERCKRIYRDEAISLDNSEFRISSSGIAFVNLTHPADADIDDGRVAN